LFRSIHYPVAEKNRCDKLRILQDLFVGEVDDPEALLFELPAFPSVFLNLCLVLMMRSLDWNREVSEACEVLFDLGMEGEADD